MECLDKDPARRPTSAEPVSTRLDVVSLESAWTRGALVGDAPTSTGGRAPSAEVLLSQEGRELRIGPRVRPMG